jgi:hypothetical protein
VILAFSDSSHRAAHPYRNDPPKAVSVNRKAFTSGFVSTSSKSKDPNYGIGINRPRRIHKLL